MNAMKRLAAGRTLTAALTVAAAAALTACAASSPAPVLLTLPTATSASVAPAPGNAASAPVLAVRRVAIPEYLVSRRVRYRADPATLAEWPNTYWAERIEIGVSREFVAALRRQLPGWSLCESGCGDQPVALSLQVELVTLDYLRSAKTLQARARIVVGEGNAGARPLQTSERAYDIPGSADTAQAEAEAIAELIRRVAQDAVPAVQAARP